MKPPKMPKQSAPAPAPPPPTIDEAAQNAEQAAGANACSQFG